LPADVPDSAAPAAAVPPVADRPDPFASLPVAVVDPLAVLFSVVALPVSVALVAPTGILFSVVDPLPLSFMLLEPFGSWARFISVAPERPSACGVAPEPSVPLFCSALLSRYILSNAPEIPFAGVYGPIPPT
jgi:hypothetical protein